MRHFPVFLDLHGRAALVVGEGPRAAARARSAAAAGAVVLRRARPDAVTPADLARAAIVLVGDGEDPGLPDLVRRAGARGVPFHVSDRTDLSTCVLPAVVDRGEIVVAIGTGGAAPILARRLRARIQALLPERLGDLAAFARRFRDTVKAAMPGFDDRRRLWESVLAGPIAELVLAGREGAARAAMVAAVNRPARPRDGMVHLVGAGPGDPELLTLRALRLIEEAEVIVHDDLVSDAVLARARIEAERVAVGKRAGRARITQAEINALLVARARAGQRVVRLKGGDPSIFGRAGEELAALRAAGVAVTVVPGITAALGCAAAIDLPLTHRDHASAVTFLAGHGRDGAEAALPGDEPAGGATLVVYMGAERAAGLARHLADRGLAPSTPVAVIENGTRPDQRVSFGTLATLDAVAAPHAGGGPALIVIGAVVGLARGAEGGAIRAAG